MIQKTHLNINENLIGTILRLSKDHSIIELKTTPEMVVDDRGLIHGGFIFGLADYAAMVAINHPNVVLGGAIVKFLKPCKQGELLKAEAVIIETGNRKQVVYVEVFNESEIIFEGNFDCYILNKHVLEGN